MLWMAHLEVKPSSICIFGLKLASTTEWRSALPAEQSTYKVKWTPESRWTAARRVCMSWPSGSVLNWANHEGARPTSELVIQDKTRHGANEPQSFGGGETGDFNQVCTLALVYLDMERRY